MREVGRNLGLIADLTGELERAWNVNVLNKVNVSTASDSDLDAQIAKLVAEATNNFDDTQLQQLKMLASESAISPRDIATAKCLTK